MDANPNGHAITLRSRRRRRILAARFIVAARAWKKLLTQEKLWQPVEPVRRPAAFAATPGNDAPGQPEPTPPPKVTIDWLWVSPFWEPAGVDPAKKCLQPGPGLAAGKTGVITRGLEKEGGALHARITQPPPRERQQGAAGFLRGCLAGLSDFTQGNLDLLPELPLLGAHPRRIGVNLEQLAEHLHEFLQEHDRDVLQKFDDDLCQLALPAYFYALSAWEKGRVTTRVVLKYARLLRWARTTTNVLGRLGKATPFKIRSLGRAIALRARKRKLPTKSHRCGDSRGWQGPGRSSARRQCARRCRQQSRRRRPHARRHGQRGECKCSSSW